MGSLPARGLLAIANPMPAKDGGLALLYSGPHKESLWLLHRGHDRENVGSKAERRAGAGWGRPSRAGATSYMRWGSQERLQHISKTARFVYFVDRVIRGVEDRFKGFKVSTGESS